MIADATAHTTDVDKLMKQVVHCGHEIMRCDICLSYLYDEDSRAFQPCEMFGLSHELIPVFRTEPLDEKAEFVKKAMEGKEPVIKQFGVISSELGVKDKSSYSELPTPNSKLFSWLPGISTLAVLPLIGKTDYLGLIIGIYKNPPESPFAKGGLSNIPPLEKGGKGGFEFTDRDMKVMQGISHEVSTALEQARLYKETVNKSMELSHKVETIQVMHEIDRSILSTLESEEIFETVVRLVARVIPCERATVGLVDRERKGFVFAAGFGLKFIPKGAFIPFETTAATEVVRTSRPQYVANLMDVKEPLPVEAGMIREGFLSHIRVPLHIKEEVVGVLVVGAKRPSAFTKEDLFTLEKLASQIGVALSNARLISDLEELFIGTVKSLASAIDAKSKWTAGHSERVTGYAVKIAKEMGMNGKELKDIELAGLLHDVGKIGTYESILDKPGKLTDEELALMRQHPGKGAEILAPIKQLKDIISGVKYHHEFYDGTGYPEGLKGDAIPLMARVLGVPRTGLTGKEGLWMLSLQSLKDAPARSLTQRWWRPF
ncbi:MAG: GAF domain-containing protein [Deltaproteobacteria bacterium]|nr:GAF domain-containing protein [Deltaproteobacteria bacterium]